MGILWRGKHRTSLSVKVIISYIIIGTAPILTAGMIIIYLTENMYASNLAGDSTEAIQAVCGELSAELLHYRETGKSLAENRQIVRAVASRSNHPEEHLSINQIIHSYKQMHDRRIQIHVLSADGNFSRSTGSIPNLYNQRTYGDYGVFLESKARGGEQTVGIMKYTSYTGEKMILTVATPILADDKTILGYVIIDVQRAAIAKIVSQLELFPVIDLILTDDRTVTVFDRENQENEGVYTKNSGYLALKNGAESREESEDIRSLQAVADSGLYLYASFGMNAAHEVTNIIERVILWVAAIAILFSIGLSFAIRATIFNPLNRLTRTFAQLRKGELNVRFTPKTTDPRELYELGEYYNNTLDKLEELINSHFEQQQMLKLAELKSLEEQIKPHFLFNYLNDVKSLAKLGKTGEIVTLVVSFGKILRDNMFNHDEFAPAGGELELAQAYIDMQNVRYLDCITFRQEVEEGVKNRMIPRFIIQPLIENAVIHGLIPKGGGVIVLRAYEEEDKLVFEVHDDGVGFEESTKTNKAEHNNLGLANIRKRVALYNKSEQDFQIIRRDNNLTVIIIKFNKDYNITHNQE